MMDTSTKAEIFENLKGFGLGEGAAAAEAVKFLIAQLGPEKALRLLVLGVLELGDMARVLGCAEQTLRNEVAKRTVPFVRQGNRNVFLVDSWRELLRQKEFRPRGNY